MYEDSHLDAAYEDRFDFREDFAGYGEETCRNIACGEDADDEDGFCGQDCRDLIMADSDFYTGPTYFEGDDPQQEMSGWFSDY